MADKSKDVIYIDIDDEITSIIDKVRASDGKILALVLPKRASVFQSIVNMKLLKRAAGEAKKRLVLITSEAGLLPLAGAVGIHVAKSLQSKPEIPAAPELVDAEESVDEDESLEGPDEVTAETAGDRPIGELAGPAAAAPLATDDAMETVELDNDDVGDAASKPVSAAPLPLAVKKDKKLRVPNFDRFRLWLALGILGVICLIVLLFVALTVLPKATITIKTNASNVNTNLNLTLDTTADSLDETDNVVPAKQVTEQKSFTQTASATGQANKGDKATGSVAMTAQACAPNIKTPSDVPAGTGVSTGGLTYITQEDASFSINGGSGSCVNYSSNDVDVTAQSAGAKYNLNSTATFTVAGRSEVTAKGTADGGTDNIVKVISQADIDGAKSKISSQDSGVKQDLQNQLTQAGYYAVMATFKAGDPNITTSANAGDAADSVTVTEVIGYTLLGAHKNDLTTLIDDQIKGQIDTAKQGILDDGLKTADIKVTNLSDKTAQLNLQATGVVGPDIKTDTVKQLAAGKKSGEVKSALNSQPGITDVSVKLSPFWVSSVPKKTSKITVTIAKPTATIKADASNP